jgi:SAM-dependent methyltransferase
MDNFFCDYQEFSDLDARRSRYYGPITTETLNSRHEVMLPEYIVKNKTVLDLGSCLGASGHWSLGHGSTHYTGVEIQKPQSDISQKLLSKYWDSNKFSIISKDFIDFLDEAITEGKRYDIVLMIGVIYAFIDQYSLLEKVSKVCDKYLLIDSVYPSLQMFGKVELESSFIQINSQTINHAEEDTLFKGLSARPSPNALKYMLGSFGFENKDGLLMPYPPSDKDVYDNYTSICTKVVVDGSGELETMQVWAKEGKFAVPIKYMMRFERTNNKIKTLRTVLNDNDESSTVTTSSTLEIENTRPIDSWKFDESVAERFQTEAKTQIPDYDRVIDLSIQLTNEIYHTKHLHIIDVGSALGHTVKKFIDAGYMNVVGVDNSPAMISNSLFPKSTICSDTFPEGEWDVVIANWTLHFIKERGLYLKSIYDNMTNGGMLIITDKMEHSSYLEKLYHAWKRSNGVTDETISNKKRALLGVLDTKPMMWYMNTLTEIGFTDIDIINTSMMFTTIYARK